MKFDYSVHFEKLSKKIKHSLKLTRIMGALHEDLCTFVGPRQCSRYRDSLLAGRFGNRIPVEGGWGDNRHPSRPALGPTQPRIQRVPGFFRGLSGRDMTLTTHPYLAPRLKKK